jgi:hypothetical protein
MEPYIQENHAMVFERMVEVDIDELFCPVCGRRILVQWSPSLRKTVLTPGNENAIHSAARGEPALREEAYGPQPSTATADRVSLADWERCLQEIDFESWWR